MGVPTREELIAQANEQNARWSQYQGYFDGFVRVTVKRDLRTKMGQAFLRGDVCIARPGVETSDEYSRYPGTTWMSVYSFRNGIVTSIRARDVEVG